MSSFGRPPLPLKWWRHFWPAPYLKHWHNSRRLIISYRKCSLKIWNDMILVSDLEGWTDLIWSIELKWYLVTCPSCEERTTSEVGTAKPPVKTKAKMLKVTASIVSQTRDPCRRWSLLAITRHCNALVLCFGCTMLPICVLCSSLWLPGDLCIPKWDFKVDLAFFTLTRTDSIILDKKDLSPKKFRCARIS